MVERRGRPSQRCRTFLRNHPPDVAAVDVWINVTTNPTAEWFACQITDAFPWDDALEYLTAIGTKSMARSSHAD